MPNQNPDLFSTQGRRECLHDSYQLVAGEITCLAELAGGVEPDDDLAAALAHLACAMKSLAAARDKALKEWAAEGGDACYTEAELDKLLGELGKIAREEPREPGLAHLDDEPPPARMYGHMGYEKEKPVPNSMDARVDAFVRRGVGAQFDADAGVPDAEATDGAF